MEVKDLKNFGRSISDISTSMPKEQRKAINERSYKIFRSHLGLFELIRFAILTKI